MSSRVLVLCKVSTYVVASRGQASAAAPSHLTKDCCYLGPNKSTMFVAWDEAKSRLVLSCKVRTLPSLDTLMLLLSLPPTMMQMISLSAGKAGAPWFHIVAQTLCADVAVFSV